MLDLALGARVKLCQKSYQFHSFQGAYFGFTFSLGCCFIDTNTRWQWMCVLFLHVIHLYTFLVCYFHNNLCTCSFRIKKKRQHKHRTKKSPLRSDNTTFTNVINAQSSWSSVQNHYMPRPSKLSHLLWNLLLEAFSLSSSASISFKCVHSSSSHQNCRY